MNDQRKKMTLIQKDTKKKLPKQTHNLPTEVPVV